MRLNKKTAMAVSFAVGSIMFITTAFAEVSSKSGYDQLKDAVKYTAGECTEKFQSYTSDFSYAVKDNGNTIHSDDGVTKVDMSKQARETNTVSSSGSLKNETYYYSDNKCCIEKNSRTNVYNEDDYTANKNLDIRNQNPFKEKEAPDIEKIADAVIGNLKDYVTVTQNADGTKEITGSLTESQIPALVNAVASYEVKREGDAEHNRVQDNGGGISMPNISSDVSVKEVKGKMTVDKDGLIKDALIQATVSGKDKQGVEHNMSFEALFKLENVNSTVVNKPDLSGKKVQKHKDDNSNGLSSNPEKYIGQYKKDIVIEKDNKFQKIGEKFLDITSVDSKSISGRYHEEYQKGYESYSNGKIDFKFTAKFDKDKFNGEFNYTSSSGNSEKGDISILPDTASISFYVPDIATGEFSRVFN